MSKSTSMDRLTSNPVKQQNANTPTSINIKNFIKQYFAANTPTNAEFLVIQNQTKPSASNEDSSNHSPQTPIQSNISKVSTTKRTNPPPIPQQDVIPPRHSKLKKKKRKPVTAMKKKPAWFRNKCKKGLWIMSAKMWVHPI